MGLARDCLSVFFGSRFRQPNRPQVRRCKQAVPRHNLHAETAVHNCAPHQNGNIFQGHLFMRTRGVRAISRAILRAEAGGTRRWNTAAKARRLVWHIGSYPARDMRMRVIQRRARQKTPANATNGSALTANGGLHPAAVFRLSRIARNHVNEFRRRAVHLMKIRAEPVLTATIAP